jgi:hypothetical protein
LTDAEWDALAARVRQIDQPITLAGAAAVEVKRFGARVLNRYDRVMGLIG